MIHVGWEKAIAGAMDITMTRRNYPGLNLGSVADSMTLGMQCFICLSLGFLIYKIGMLTTPTYYEDQMN